MYVYIVYLHVLQNILIGQEPFAQLLLFFSYNRIDYFIIQAIRSDYKLVHAQTDIQLVSVP